MSLRQNKEDRRPTARNLAVTSKCLAIVLLPQKKQAAKFDCGAAVVTSGVSNDHSGGGSGGAGFASGSGSTLPKQASVVVTTAQSSSTAQCNGKEILEDFKQQNKTCYWNPALIESIKQLEYLGFVEPCTVLVGGDDIHLENLRSAWGRRVLKPPSNYTIDRIGDVNGIEMQVIPQTQFIPLPDSLCLIIAELNNAGQPATLESIRSRLQRWYHNTSLPSQQLIYDTLGTLIRERKVFHNGSSYCVVTPETYHLSTTNPSMACTASWLPYHPMYIPVFPHPHPPPHQHQPQPSLRAPTRSISCQVTHIEDKLSSEGSQRPQKPRLRSHSVRACRGKDKAAVFGDDTTLDLKRASSIKYKAEKAKAITKDLNLKSSNINQEKEKGEKVSLFSKIFGRKKKKHTDAGTATSTSSGGGNQSTEVEYATFSAQFPPPEWVWYQQQLERQKRTEEWVSQQVLKSTPWQQFGLPVSSSVDSGTLSRARTESLHNQLHHANAYNPAKSHIYATLSTIGPGQSVATDGGFRGMSEGSGVAARALSDKRREEETNMKQTNYATVINAKKGHSHGHHHRHHHGHHKQKEHKKALHENNYDVPASSLPAQGIAPSNARVDIMEEDNIYCSPCPIQQTSTLPWHSTPYYDVPPSQMDSQFMPSHIVCNNTLQTKVADNGKLFANTGHRRSHRPRQRGHKAYSYYDTTVGTDISIEYKGRLPKKNSQVAQSRDSGVNCVGMYRNPQYYMNKSSHPQVQESLFYGAAEGEHATISTHINTMSSVQPDVQSVQRGTPYTSMEQRSPEGCSEHHPIINVISTSINDTGGTGVDRYTTENSFGAEDPSGRHLEDRLECEGYSQDAMPSFVAVSYCDSSIGEEGAGEVVLCQAEINHRQVPQLVLDTERRGDRNTLAEEPDVALSNAGSKDTLERTAGESEHSLQTVVVHSPNSCSDVESKTSTKTTGCGGSRALTQDSHDRADRNGAMQEVTRLGGELQELGVVDSGFNSPRNSDDKENQQQQTLGLPQVGNNQRHGQHGAKQHHQQAVSPQEEIPAPEHKSKHERIKAFVKQSNQMLEQRQINSLAGAHPHVSDLYSNYAGHGQPSSHLHLNQHYNSLPKPLHPIQHHHVQQLQLPQPASLNNQRHHHHHHHHGRPHSLHGTTYERPRSQGVWAAGEGSPPNDLHTFQQQQLNGKKFGLNGEFEVVGVV